MPCQEAERVQPEQEMKKRVKQPASILSREHGRRLDGDDSEPHYRGEPCSPDARSGCSGSAQRASAPTVAATAARLFERIIGSLARDDDVVHVALAETRPADSHKTRFLLQFRNRRASAVAHA